MNKSEDIAAQLDGNEFQILDVIVTAFPNGQVFAGKWVRQECEKKHVPFYQVKLTKLAKLGLLQKMDSTRGGNRRYYRLTDDDLAKQVLSLAGSPVG